MKIKLKGSGNIFGKHLRSAAKAVKTAVKLEKAVRSAVDERVKTAIAKELARHRADGFDAGARPPPARSGGDGFTTS